MQKIRTQLLGGAALVALTGAAYAADMGVPMKAPPVAAPPPLTWTGLYIGGNLGAGFGDKWWNCAANNFFDCEGSTGTFGTTSMDGFMGGGQIGYNWQNGQWVFGIEGTFDWTDMHGQFPLEGPALPASSRLSWIATIVGRVGVTIDRALIYAGGGVAWTHEKDSFTFPDGEGFFGSNTPVGATFLTGVEYAIDPHWSARIQYNYYDFGSKGITLTPNFACTGSPECTFPMSTELRVHSITAGVNYRFWGW